MDGRRLFKFTTKLPMIISYEVHTPVIDNGGNHYGFAVTEAFLYNHEIVGESFLESEVDTP